MRRLSSTCGSFGFSTNSMIFRFSSVCMIPKPGRRRAVHRDGAHGNVRARLEVLAQDVPVVHPIELVAAQNDVVIDRTLEEVAQVLPDRVGSSLIPMRSLGSLLRRQDLDEARREIVELVARVDMAVQRHAVELSEHVDAANARIEAIADRNINQPVLAAERHGRLRPFLCQREKPGAGSPSHDDGQSTIDREDQGKLHS